MIVNETLREIQNEQVLSQGKGKEMIEKEINTEAPASSKSTEETDSDIQKNVQADQGKE